ncbi:MAG TPA: hypothetical protein VE570_00225 [Thermoleophilaceae bacterium]|jgi:hypothetical protein|nr:hypothetical protein [Thermoleophilaceae bacterium]
MTVDDASATLEAMLVAVDLDPERLDLGRTWEVFTSFAAQPTEGVDARMDGDRLLFETTLAPATRRDGAAGSAFPPAPQAYHVFLTREYYRTDEAGDYRGARAVTVTLQFEPTTALRGLEDEQVTGCGGPPWLDEGFDAALDWARRVERRPAFQTLLAGPPPLDGFMREDRG